MPSSRWDDESLFSKAPQEPSALSRWDQFDELGKTNKPGFVSDIKRGTGQIIESAGSALRDLGAEDTGKAIEEYGTGVVRRNPSQINSLSDVVDKPLTTAREAVGEVVPQIGGNVAGGLAGRVIGGALGLPLGPAGVAIGQNLGAAAGAYGFNLLQEYGGIRKEQRDQGIEDKTRALGTAGAAAALDTAFGTERVVGKFLKEGADQLARKEGTDLLKHVGKQAGIGILQESPTEIAQTGLERYGAYKPLTGEEAVNEYGLAGIKGGIGGGMIRGGMASVAGTRKDDDAPGNDIKQTFKQPEVNSDPVTTTDIAPPAPPAPPAQTTWTAPNGDVWTKTGRDEDGRPIWEKTSGTAAPAAPAAPAVPVAPAVNGGSTDIAQSQAAAAQQTAAANTALQEQAGREQAFETVGATMTSGPAGPGITVFGQSIFGPQVPQFGTALARKINALPAHGQEVVKAIAEAHMQTGGKLVSFNYNGSNPIGSADALVKSLSKVADKFQIGHANTAEQAAAILNEQSKTAKGDKLEQINAIHVALTGEDTAGFLASQTTEGAKNGKLQLQDTAGLGTVREQGGSAEANGANAGAVQPGGVQPVGAGSQPEGSLGLQVGQPAGSGVRDGTGAVSDSGVGTAQAPQVTPTEELANEQGQPTATGEVAVQPSGQAAAGTGVQETAGVSGEVSETEEVSGALESIVQEVMRLLIKPTSRMDEETARKQREFVFTLLMNGPYDSLAVMAADFGIKPHQAKDWSAKAGKIKEDPAQIAAAFNAVAEQRGTSVAELMAEIRNKQEATPGEAVMPDDSQGTSRTEEPMSSDDTVVAEDEEGGEVSDREVTDEGLAIKGRKSGESIQERYNAVETNQAKFLRISQQLAKAEDAGDQEEVDRLNAELDKVMAKGVEQNNKRTKSTGEKPATAQREPDSAEMTAAAERWKAVGGDLTQLTDNELKAILARAQKFNNKKLTADVSAELTSRGVEHAVQEQSAGKVDVREPAGDGKTVGEGNAKPEKPAGEGEKPKRTRKKAVAAEKEVDLRPDDIRAGEAWDAVAKDFPDAPLWAELTDEQRETFVEFGENNWTPDDVQAELIKLAKGGTSANVERKSNSEKIFELQRTRAEPKQGDLIKFNLPHVPGGYEVDASVGESVYMDKYGREVPAGTPGASRYVYLTYKVDGQQITTYYSAEELRLNTLGNIAAPKLYNVNRGNTSPESGRKIPSFIRGMATLLRLRNNGKITDEQFAARADDLYEQVQAAKDEKLPNPRQRGALFIRQRLLEAVRKGWITERTADMAEWFIKQNPALVKTLGISFTGKEEGKSGEYAHFTRIMTLLKGSGNEETPVHEMLHHLERMMSTAVQNAIRSAWLRSLLKAEKGATGELRQFYDLLMDYHFGNGRKASLDAATQMIIDGKVGYEHYQHVNSSEFWATNASRIMEGRFDVRDSIVGKIKQFLKEFIEHVKGVFGFKSDAAVLKALSSVMKGDGKFLPGQFMLQEGVGYNMFLGRTAAERMSAAEKEAYKAQVYKDWGDSQAMLDILLNETVPTKMTDLEDAKRMQAAGEPLEKIWYDTGWFEGPDGNWRFEIDDTQAKFAQPFDQIPVRQPFDRNYQNLKLGDVLDHPLLFKIYPELADVGFKVAKPLMDFGQGTQGWYEPDTGDIAVTPYAQDPLSTLLHEVQHWVQRKEGLAPGGNSNASRLDNREALNKLLEIFEATKREGNSSSVSSKTEAAVQTLLEPATSAKVATAYAKVTQAEQAVTDAKEAHKWAEADRDALIAVAREEYNQTQKALKAQMDAIRDKQLDRSIKFASPEYKELEEQHSVLFKQLIALQYPSLFDKKYSGPVEAARNAIDAAKDAKRAAEKDLDAVIKEAVGYSKGDIQYLMYKMVSGEAEARNTQARQKLTLAERREFNPEVTVDIPSDLQLVLDVDSPTTSANIERLPAPLQAPTRAVTTNTWAGVKKAGLALAITEDVIKLAMKTMRSAGDYLKAQYAQQAARLKFELNVEKILQQFDKLPKNLQGTGEGSVNALIHDMTMEGKWGFVPTYAPGTKVDPEMRRRFDAIKSQSPAAAKLIQDVFEHGYAALKMKQQAVKDAAEKVFAEREANAQGDAKELADIALERKAFQAKFDRVLKIKTAKPYAYLGRYGNYVAVAKSTDFIEAQRLSRNGDLAATKWLKENESNPDHYVVAFAETQAEADAIAARLRGLGKFQVTDAYEKLAGDAYAGGGDLFLAFKRMENMITRKAKNGAESGDVLDGMRKLMTDLYLTTLAEASAQMPTLARKSIYGADKDMMRNLATRGRADAHFLAALQHGNSITDAMDRMMDEAENNRRESTPVLNELLKRQAQSMQYKLPGGVAQVATQLSTVYYLSTSPAFYLQQLLQTAVLSLPFMSGRLGYFRSARAIQQAYRDVLGLVKGSSVTDHVDFDKAPADVRTMLDTLVGMGKIDIGIDNDAKARSGDQGVVSKVMRKLQGVNTRIETINRAVAAIAAYRGYLQKYGADKTAAATQYAADVVSNTHGSYDGFNTPRALSSDVGRVVGQFKRFQIIQLSMLGKLIHTAFKSADKEEKAVARASLKFITTHMAVLGGALGVPFVSQIGNILLGIFGDDDEPKDLEQFLRGVIDDKATADLLLRGVTSSVGLESLGKKLAMENVASLLPFTELDLSNRDALTKVYVALLGPSAALSLKFADGLGVMGKGDYYKGLEMLLPNGVSNLLKAGRFASEGVSMRNGDTVMGSEEMTMLDAAFQAIGLPTDTIADRQRVQKVVAETDQFYEDRAAQVKHDYTKAFKNGDSAAMQDAREAWTELQDARARNGYSRQPLSTLFRAPMQQMKRERGVAGGVEYSKTNRAFVERVAAQ